MQHKSWIILFLALIIFGLYSQTLDNPLVFDSSNILKFLNINDWGSVSFLDYRIFNHLSFYIVHQIFGDDLFWQRFFNVVLHISNCIFIYLLMIALLKYFSKNTIESIDHYIAFGVAILFGVHPVGVYATAYLIQRSILLAAGFSVLALLSWLRGCCENTNQAINKWSLLSLLCYYFAIHSKEHVVLLPLVVGVLIILSPINRKILFKNNIVYFSLSFIMALQVVFKLRSILTATIYEPTTQEMILGATQITQTSAIQPDLFMSIQNQSWMFFIYLKNMIFPYSQNLAIDLQYPFELKLISWPATLFFIIYVSIPFILFVLWRFIKLNKLIILSFMIPWVLFIAEFSVVRFTEQFVLYRSYSWMIGYPVFMFVLLKLLYDRIKNKKMVMGVLLVLLALLSWQQQKILPTFVNQLALWQDAVDKNEKKGLQSKRNFRMYSNLGASLMQDGQTTRAAMYLKKAISLNPEYVVPRHNLASIYLIKKDYHKAIAEFESALKINKDYPSTYYNLGLAYEAAGNLEEAVLSFEKMIEYEPNHFDALFQLGLINQKLKSYQASIKYYIKVLKQKPRSADIRLNIGYSYLYSGQKDVALKYFKEALLLKPHSKLIKKAIQIANEK
ncbi:hypothetical protein BVY03_00300 [bacterium K02(2017)]|nr:hypothetical protein BVY03_00300 [bacterium K02(2017)]